MSDNLTKQRGGLRSAISVSIKEISQVIETEDVSKIQALGERITELLGKVKNLDDQIMQNITEEDALGKHFTETSKYNSHVREMVILLEQRLLELRNSKPQTPQPTKTVKLPTLSLPTFSGDYTEWNSFWDLFKAGVHQKTEISEVEKLIYLRGQLEGSALQLVSGFGTEGQYYNEVITLLEKTYGKTDEIKVAHIKKLLELKHPSLDTESLRDFQANFECQIRSLGKLKLTLEEFYTVLLYNKLPNELGTQVRRDAGDDWLQYDVFKKHLDKEIGNFNVSNSF